MKSPMMILLCLLATLLCASCASVVSGGWGSKSVPAPPSMGEACQPMAVHGVPSNTQGMTAEDKPLNKAQCGAKWLCTGGPCTYVSTSPAQPPGTLLAFICDVRGPNSLGPSSNGGTQPIMTATLSVGPGGWYGTSSPTESKPVVLAGPHFIRHFAQTFIAPNTLPLSATAELKLPQGSEIGQCGWRRWAM